jgi:nicotinamide-nucleotide amidase
VYYDVIIAQLAADLGAALLIKQYKLAIAESCTGGMLAETITRVAGSSAWFEQGFVTYSNSSKQTMLKVKANSLDRFGAVSKEVAKEMAAGVFINSQADCSLAVTGIAGPGGGSINKPVGGVWFAWGFKNKDGVEVEVEHKQFFGDRTAIRLQATQFALQRMLELVLKK